MPCGNGEAGRKHRLSRRMGVSGGKILEPALSSSRPLLPKVGTTVGAFSVVSRRDDDAVEVRDEAGRLMVLAFGDLDALEREAHAMRLLRESVTLPVVHGLHHDTRFGAYLVLEPRGDDAGNGSGDRARAWRVQSVLTLAKVIEQAGFAWVPDVRDVGEGKNGLVLHRLRGVVRLEDGEHGRDRLDASAVLGAIAIDLAATVAPSDLRALLRTNDRRRTIEAVEATLRAAAVNAPGDDVPGAGACSDIGLLRERNEDWVELAVVHLEGGRDAIIAVVCDGVSASKHADKASSIAAKTTRERIERSEEEAPVAVYDAVCDAHDEICKARDALGGESLGTTIVVAHVVGRRATIGWVGDSRAYFVPRPQGEHRAAMLTRDHSWLEEALASGATTYEDAIRSPFAHALTRCLGPLEGSEPAHSEPELVEIDLECPGVLILCTDGLWNYAPSADAVAEIVHALPDDASCTAIAHALVAYAIVRGGQDNVTVSAITIR